MYFCFKESLAPESGEKAFGEAGQNNYPDRCALLELLKI
jgi:hypothetical protein